MTSAASTTRCIPRWTSTSTIPPAAQALADLAARAAGPGEDADAVAYDLYEQIRQETARVSGLEATRGELAACRALLRVLHKFAGGRAADGDDTAKRVDATISRFNLGTMFRPGGGADRYLIPLELADEESP